jgi:hypothetical protein
LQLKRVAGLELTLLAFPPDFRLNFGNAATMKSSALLFWSVLAPALGMSLASSAGSPYKKLYVFHTTKGPFYIAEWKKRFYPMFGEETLGSFSTPEDAAEDLAYGRVPSLPGIDITSLHIPRDLKKWQRV